MFGGWGGAWGSAWGATGGASSPGGIRGSDFQSLFLTARRKKLKPKEIDEAIAEAITVGPIELEQTPQLVFVAPVQINWAAVERIKREATAGAQAAVLKSISRVIKAAQEADDAEVELLLLN